jgi:hypothetical protein
MKKYFVNINPSKTVEDLDVSHVSPLGSYEIEAESNNDALNKAFGIFCKENPDRSYERGDYTVGASGG